MKIKMSWQNGIELDTDGQACWSSVIVAAGFVIDLGIYAWRHIS